MAKTIVQIADANMHEASTHLARTHLMLEPFVIATERQLAWNHPVGLLLRPHFEGTLFINDLAQSFLIAPGGPVDELLVGTLDATRELAARALADYSLNHAALPAALPAALHARGVDDASVLPHYPYRDDALLYWRVIKRWVHDYVRTYYRSSREVVEDTELAKWCRELGHAGARRRLSRRRGDHDSDRPGRCADQRDLHRQRPARGGELPAIRPHGLHAEHAACRLRARAGRRPRVERARLPRAATASTLGPGSAQHPVSARQRAPHHPR